MLLLLVIEKALSKTKPSYGQCFLVDQKTRARVRPPPCGGRVSRRTRKYVRADRAPINRAERGHTRFPSDPSTTEYPTAATAAATAAAAATRSRRSTARHTAHAERRRCPRCRAVT